MDDLIINREVMALHLKRLLMDVYEMHVVIIGLLLLN